MVADVIFVGVLFLMFEVIAFVGEEMIRAQRATGWILVFPRYVFMAYAFVALGYFAVLVPLSVWILLDIRRCRMWWSYWMDKKPFG
jgi:hypothetical protein